MYPLNAILITQDENLLPHARRELLNLGVHLETHLPGVSEAISAIRKLPAEKRLLIVHMTSALDLEALGALTIQCPGSPVVALVEGYDPGTSLGSVVIGIMRAGASQIVSLPLQTDDFKTALDQIAIQFVYSFRDTKVIAVAGVTGGSGATSVALNLAFEIAQSRGLRCILVDLSLRMGVIASHLDIEPTHTIVDLLHDMNRVDTTLVKKVLIRVAENLELLPGPSHFSGSPNTSPLDVARLINTLTQMTDVVILDVPCTYDDVYFETLADVGMTILIGEQKFPSIRALKMVHDALRRVSGTERLVINRYDPKNRGFTLDSILKPLGISAIHTVARDDQGMAEALNAACSLHLAAPNSLALADIIALSEAVLAPSSPQPTKRAGLFVRLRRAFANS